jgi:hypothetical protein
VKLLELPLVSEGQAGLDGGKTALAMAWSREKRLPSLAAAERARELRSQEALPREKLTSLQPSGRVARGTISLKRPL